MHITTQHQLADIFTKALDKAPFEYLLSKMNIVNIYSSRGEYCEYTLAGQWIPLYRCHRSWLLIWIDLHP
jgi:hypothetical protein